ncbi:hypothetical protein DMC64_41640 [Amycolatopsis sp. WAC 04197]|uniref:hypothetical protein n=1 Tax=Amycolatopsis sp. WAC 04197 TaxID=2203199 RepID=UPI000F775CA5|nr:hypothetical protein [Amycolatopsis sp. WAC 04197]RSN38573.1 hypothetical protein DMC64_41640 [Amycolatopsis sp. WAC 04197]
MRPRPRPTDDGDDVLADADVEEFMELLLLALDSPEVRVKLREVFPAAAAPIRAATPPARGGGARRGR